MKISLKELNKVQRAAYEQGRVDICNECKINKDKKIEKAKNIEKANTIVSNIMKEVFDDIMESNKDNAIDTWLKNNPQQNPKIGFVVSITDDKVCIIGLPGKTRLITKHGTKPIVDNAEELKRFVNEVGVEVIARIMFSDEDILAKPIAFETALI